MVGVERVVNLNTVRDRGFFRRRKEVFPVQIFKAWMLSHLSPTSPF